MIFRTDIFFWTITIGAIATVLNQELSHLVRAEGHAGQAGFGVALGGILNIIFDPVFIFLLGLDLTDATIATMLSNAIATLYFIFIILKKAIPP